MKETAEMADLKYDLAPRRCMREPIAEIAEAAQLLSRAVDADEAGQNDHARQFLMAANLSAIREWTESLWGAKAANPNQQIYRRKRIVANAPPRLPKELRVPERMPSASEKSALVAQYGYHCAFCGIPLIRQEVRSKISKAYPEARIWGKSNLAQHAAFQCMWMQFDHILPHSRGGDNSLQNLVITCAPCNFGRTDSTLEEFGLIDPRTMPVKISSWDGLERFRSSNRRRVG